MNCEIKDAECDTILIALSHKKDVAERELINIMKNDKSENITIIDKFNIEHLLNLLQHRM